MTEETKEFLDIASKTLVRLTIEEGYNELDLKMTGVTLDGKGVGDWKLTLKKEESEDLPYEMMYDSSSAGGR